MDVLVPVLMLGAACAGSFLLQRWIARAHPDLPDPRPCGGCCGDRLCEIQKDDPWCSADGREGRTAAKPPHSR